MEVQQHTESAFAPISASFAAKIFNEAIIVQSFFTQNFNSSNNIVLTLTRNHIIARSNSKVQNDKMFVAQINFDLKFQTIYTQEKNVHSKKIGIKFMISTTQFNCFYSQDISIIQIWIHHLSKLINQKGFHQLFKPIKKLGKGNFASVYQVQRVTDLRRFAVKAFSKQNTFAAKNGKQSLMNELSVMRSLNHSNILRLESVFESDNSIYVVLEVLSGGQLFHKIQKTKGHFSKDQVRSFMKGLLEGLSHMHQNRIMHRDLKPENIMLRNDNCMDPVIVDFGLATNADLDKYLFYRCGTPGYVAPQIVSLTQNVHVQPQCDIFSAGVIFHILLLRKPLFQGTKYDQVYRNNKQMKFDLNTQVYNKLESQQIQLLKRMLTQNPQERISASQALKHSYFKSMGSQEYQKQIGSPQMTTASEKAPKIKKILKF